MASAARFTMAHRRFALTAIMIITPMLARRTAITAQIGSLMACSSASARGITATTVKGSMGAVTMDAATTGEASAAAGIMMAGAAATSTGNADGADAAGSTATEAGVTAADSTVTAGFMADVTAGFRAEVATGTVASMVEADFAVAVVTEVAATAVVTADVTNEFGY